MRDINLSKVREEYCEYMLNKIRSTFTLSDWYEQTYGKPLNDDDRDTLIKDVTDQLMDEIEDSIPDMIASKV